MIDIYSAFLQLYLTTAFVFRNHDQVKTIFSETKNISSIFLVNSNKIICYDKCPLFPSSNLDCDIC